MKKKIIDISPPQTQAKSIEIEKRKEKRPHFRFYWKILIVFLICFIGIIALSNQSKLDLKIQPYLEPLSFEETFEVRIGAEDIDLEGKIVPGRFFSQDFEKWQQFESTGISQETGKAQGKIRVYNRQSPPTSVTLRAGTRFLSSENGKIFRCRERIYIPAAKISQGKVVPSSVEVVVVAQEPGEDYNIGPSKFSLPGLVGTSLYYTVFAESQSPMTGGFVKEVKVVSVQDLKNAQDFLEKVLLQGAKSSLKSKTSQDFVLLDNAVFKEESDIHCLQKPGQEYAEFSCQGKIRIKGLGFRLSDLKTLSREFVAKIISPSEKLVEESLSFEYLSQSLVPKKGKMVLDLKIVGSTYKDIPLETLKEQIEGKSKAEIKEIIFNNYPQIESTRMKFWPFWIKRAPKTSERIRIELATDGLNGLTP